MAKFCSSCGKQLHDQTKGTSCRSCYNSNRQSDNHINEDQLLNSTTGRGEDTTPHFYIDSKESEEEVQDLFEKEFLDKSITELSVAGLISIINKVNSSTVLAELQKINKEIDKSKADVKHLQDTVKKNKIEFDTTKKKTNTKLTAMEENNKLSREMTEKICLVMKNHQQTIDSVEFKQRESNLIVRGIPEEEPPNKEKDRRAIQQLMHHRCSYLFRYIEFMYLKESYLCLKINNTNRYQRDLGR